VAAATNIVFVLLGLLQCFLRATAAAKEKAQLQKGEAEYTAERDQAVAAATAAAKEEAAADKVGNEH
jgi:hypothetical protein